MLIVGLTGNYGMGKSTVLGIFRKLGAVTVDADEIVDALLREDVVVKRIGEIFGNIVFLRDGALDRTVIARAIFQDAELREKIEALLHPLVFERIRETLERLGAERGGDTVAIVEIPLLFEKGHGGRYQRTVTVFTDEETALRRLAEAGVGGEDARLRLKAQMPIEEKVRASDYVIDNNGPLDMTEAQVARIFRELREEQRKTRKGV